MTDQTEVRTYTVTITSPRLSGPLVMDLIATSPARAISRARGTAMHMYRDMWPYDDETTFDAVDIGGVEAIRARDEEERQRAKADDDLAR